MKVAIRAFLIACLLIIPSAAFANAFILANLDEDKTIIAKNADDRLSIASITKMMTCTVILRDNINLDESVPVTGNHVSRTAQLRPGMQIPRRALLQLAMVSSDNLAAYSLAASYPGGVVAFVARMNVVAHELGMYDSSFTDPTGILATNISTAKDIIILLKESSTFAEMQIAANTVHGRFSVEIHNQIKHLIYSTTNVFAAFFELYAAKTGWTKHAGRCLAMIIHIKNKRYAVVVLGANSPEHRKSIVDNLIRLI